MKRLLFLAAAIVSLQILAPQHALAGGSCPGGSVFSGGKGHGAGGVCVDKLTDEIVKTIRPRSGSVTN